MKSWYHVSLERWPVLKTSSFYSFHIHVGDVCWCGFSLFVSNRFVLCKFLWKRWQELLKLQARSIFMSLKFVPLFNYHHFNIGHSFVLQNRSRCPLGLSFAFQRTKKNAYFSAHANKWNKHTLFHMKRAMMEKKKAKRIQSIWVCYGPHRLCCVLDSNQPLLASLAIFFSLPHS